MSKMKKTICLTFDVEDYFQVENLREKFPYHTWDDQELRVSDNVYKILDLLDKYDIKATFFVLGWIAERLPSLIRSISGKGHEIASHGYNHNLNFINLISKTDLKKDILRSKNILEEICGIEVRGYRAPCFSVSDYLLKVIKELNFDYDSSLNSFSANPRYGRISGKHGCEPFYHTSGIFELPIPVYSMGQAQISIGGGGYFRMIPLPIYEYLIRQFMNRHNLLIFYLHPWEIDPAQPRIEGIRWDYSIRHYIGLNHTLKKLDRLIGSFRGMCHFLSINKYLENLNTGLY